MNVTSDTPGVLVVHGPSAPDYDPLAPAKPQAPLAQPIQQETTPDAVEPEAATEQPKPE